MKQFLTILFLMIWFNSLGTTYYIAAAGNDNNNGTSQSTPWKTLTKLNSFFSSLQSGDHVLFNKGDMFYGTIKPSKGFTIGNPVVFGAYGAGANPVITGFKTVAGFTNLGSNIWESTAAVSTLNDVNCVVINGINTAMGRYPNAGYLTYQSHATTVSITSSSLTGSTNWTGADLILRTWNFAIARNLITAHSGSTLTYKSTTVDNGNDGFGFFIENDARTLDAQNEWYYNPSTKKLRIYSTVSPVNVQVSTLDTLVYIVKLNNFTFDGIDFTGSNRRAFYIGSSSGITIQNCNFNFHGLYAVWGGNNHGSSSGNFNFNHNTVNHINSQAIVLQSEFVNPYIAYNDFKNCGVLAGMFKIAVAGGQWAGAYGAIRCQNSNGLHVEYNTIDSSGYTGIHFEANNVTVNNNRVLHCNVQLMDGGAIYTWTGPGAVMKNVKIYNNIVSDALADNAGTVNKTAPIAHGIYLDDNSANCQVYNNTAFNFPYSGIYFHNAHECSASGNTVFNCGVSQMLFAYKDYAIRNDTMVNNIFVARDATQRTAQFSSPVNDVTSFFTVLDNNIYARPADDNITFFISISNPQAFLLYTLAQWKAYVGKDGGAAKSPKAITNLNDLRIEFNASSASKTIALDGNYIDVKNRSYNGSITLAPYTSAVLVRNGGVSTNKAPVGNAGPDQTVRLPAS